MGNSYLLNFDLLHTHCQGQSTGKNYKHFDTECVSSEMKIQDFEQCMGTISLAAYHVVHQYNIQKALQLDHAARGLSACKLG